MKEKEFRVYRNGKYWVRWDFGKGGKLQYTGPCDKDGNLNNVSQNKKVKMVKNAPIKAEKKVERTHDIEIARIEPDHELQDRVMVLERTVKELVRRIDDIESRTGQLPPPPIPKIPTPKSVFIKKQLSPLPDLPRIPEDIPGVSGEGVDAERQFDRIIGRWKRDLTRPQLKVLVAHDFTFDVSKSRYIHLREQKIAKRDDIKVFVFDWVEV